MVGSTQLDALAVRSLRSDQVADLNQRSRRREASGGQSDEAIVGRKLKAIPDAPGYPDDMTAGQAKKVGNTDQCVARWVLVNVATVDGLVRLAAR
jgi:hypothetical protein